MRSRLHCINSYFFSASLTFTFYAYTLIIDSCGGSKDHIYNIITSNNYSFDLQYPLLKNRLHQKCHSHPIGSLYTS